MSLETGGIHPLAKKADIPLETQLPVNMLDVRADIIGEHVVLVLVDLRPNDPEDDAIYLVDWKRGTMRLVRKEEKKSGFLTRIDGFPEGSSCTEWDV
jgi:hypothetical protein